MGTQNDGRFRPPPIDSIVFVRSNDFQKRCTKRPRRCLLANRVMVRNVRRLPCYRVPLRTLVRGRMLVAAKEARYPFHTTHLVGIRKLYIYKYEYEYMYIHVYLYIYIYSIYAASVRCVAARRYVAANGYVAASGYAAASGHVAASGYVAANGYAAACGNVAASGYVAASEYVAGSGYATDTTQNTKKYCTQFSKDRKSSKQVNF